jgi:hypothetical protein
MGGVRGRAIEVGWSEKWRGVRGTGSKVRRKRLGEEWGKWRWGFVAGGGR